jgi:hypothetical protein
MIGDTSGSYGQTFAVSMLAAGVAFLLFCSVGKEKVNGGYLRRLRAGIGVTVTERKKSLYVLSCHPQLYVSSFASLQCSM